ncbi:MAG: RNA methyltransferase [Okeania sp. SIO3I5]|uniref:TrmH family RNA methyltransferase n=1 Tax=Okeania sp. SIO3I5 TaxID=2607805 RepID=UPI0013B81659|nr:RNA methyltransferase [Okeania sp. SIO3I5]NEQ35661.1 RNA methyltransferase [Okeania sp. SIO3I5]
MLTSLQNPLVKQIRQLHQSKGRREQQLFLVEGTHLLEEACRRNYPLITVCCTPEWQEKHKYLSELVSQKSQRIELVSARVLSSLATTVNPDGVVAIAPQKPTNCLKITSLGIALDKIQDPGNLGTIIRTATATNIDGLWLSTDTVDLHHPKVVRASAGVWFQLPMAISKDLKTEVLELQSQGLQIIATVPNSNINYWEIDLRKPTLIVLGNEGSGISKDLIDFADYSVKIPLSNGVESLNVAISTAIILYEVQRQRQT